MVVSNVVENGQAIGQLGAYEALVAHRHVLHRRAADGVGALFA